MKHTLLLSLATCTGLFISFKGSAQTEICASGVPSQQWESRFQELIQDSKSNSAGKTQSVVYTIPVIIHVIHGGQAIGTYPNLAQAQLNSQIPVLNNDYAGVGLYSGNYPAVAFTNYVGTQGLQPSSLDNLGRIAIANCNVQFCFATKDTLGNVLTEPGIDRVNYITKGWSDPHSYTTTTSFQNFINNTVKPGSIWNPTKYLNLWLTDENINAVGGLLGFATFPPLSGLGSSIPAANAGNATTDGVWCYAKAFGSATTFSAGTYYTTGYNKGRTASHEVGHWLGLRHIWGDSNCATDYCEDTPPAAAANSGTPAYPYHIGTCVTNGNDNSLDGEMFMNFMDYTNDNGKYMFTPEQAQRMLTALTNSPYRKLMGTHGLCTVSQVAANSTFTMAQAACAGASISLNNTTAGTPVPSYSWSGTGGATFTPNINATSPTVSFPTAGIYTITLTSNNGTISSTSQTISVNPAPNLVLSIASNTVCDGDQVSITATGANFYSWSPGSIISSSLSFVMTQGASSFTCNATGTNGCKARGYVSVTATECTGIVTLAKNNQLIQIFPNPANSLVTLHSDVILQDVTAELTDLTGKKVMQQSLAFTKEKSEYQLTIAHLDNGVYILKLQSKGYSQIIKLVKNN